jgi:hypothetical protein
LYGPATRWPEVQYSHSFLSWNSSYQHAYLTLPKKHNGLIAIPGCSWYFKYARDGLSISIGFLGALNHMMEDIFHAYFFEAWCTWLM